MTPTENSRTNLLDLLPHGSVAEIHDQITKDAAEDNDGKKVISYRQLLRILSGECADNHSIIPIALKKIKKHQRQQAKLQQFTASVTQTSSPLNQNRS